MTKQPHILFPFSTLSQLIPSFIASLMWFLFFFWFDVGFCVSLFRTIHYTYIFYIILFYFIFISFTCPSSYSFYFSSYYLALLYTSINKLFNLYTKIVKELYNNRNNNTIL